MQIEVMQADITRVAADVIVNAANSSLLGGGGVEGAIHRVGGPEILEECRRIRQQPEYRDGLPTGKAVQTGAGSLPARWVIHTVGPVYDRDEKPAELLASCYRESLRLADSLGASTIAFPAISTGAYGYPISEAADVAVRAIKTSGVDLARVLLVCFDRPSADAFRAALDRP